MHRFPGIFPRQMSLEVRSRGQCISGGPFIHYRSLETHHVIIYRCSVSLVTHLTQTSSLPLLLLLFANRCLYEVKHPVTSPGGWWGPPSSVVWCNAGRRTEESGECRENVIMGLPGLDLAVVCGNAYPDGSFFKHSLYTLLYNNNWLINF